MSSFYQNKDIKLGKQMETPQSAYLTDEIIMTWLERWFVVQTSQEEEDDENSEEVRKLLNESI